MFRRPGDMHCHFFGTATLSFADGIRAEPGDVFEISAERFGAPLSNPYMRGDPLVPAARACDGKTAGDGRRWGDQGQRRKQ